MAAVRYLVDDLKPAVTFYTEHLGFEVEREYGPVTILKRDGLAL